MSDDLIERLRATYRKEYAPTGSTVSHPRLVRSVILSTNVLYNPDGPEAADRIEAQAAEIDRLREAGNNLGFYAGHEDACDCVKGWAKGPCNCGYTEAWQAWHNLAGKAEQ